MKTTLGVTISCLAFALGSATLQACSSSESPLDGADAASVGADSGGPEADGGDGGAVDDTDASGHDSGTSDPGKVQCGPNATCRVPAQICCIQGDGFVNCIDEDGGSCPENSASVRCDEKADCGGVAICCGEIKVTFSGTQVKVSGVRTSCEVTCEGGYRKQLCKTSAECQKGEECITQSCGGYTISTCGGASGACK